MIRLLLAGAACLGGLMLTGCGEEPEPVSPEPAGLEANAPEPIENAKLVLKTHEGQEAVQFTKGPVVFVASYTGMEERVDRADLIRDGAVVATLASAAGEFVYQVDEATLQEGQQSKWRVEMLFESGRARSNEIALTLDRTKPALTVRSLKENEVVAPDAPLWFLFSEPVFLDLDSTWSSTLEETSSYPYVKVPDVTIEAGPSGRVDVRPAAPLKPGTRYRIVLNLKDRAGNGELFYFQFSTAP